MANNSIKTISLLNLNKDEVKEWLSKLDTILCDCDGVLWHDDTSLPNVPELIQKLETTYNKSIYFVTNNGKYTRYEIWQRALKLGYKIKETQIIAPAYTVARYLERYHIDRFKTRKVYLIGMESIGKELTAVGIPYFGVGPDIVNSMKDIEATALELLNSEEAGAVIIGHDEHFSYAKMLKATNYLDKKSPNGDYECLFLTTNTEGVYKYPTLHIPDTGSIVKAIETSTGRQALDMGKPNPMVCDDLIKNNLIKPERTLMVGDNVKIDILFGKNCGFQTLLVDCGQDRLNILQKRMQENSKEYEKYLPDFHLPQLGDLLQFL